MNTAADIPFLALAASPLLLLVPGLLLVFFRIRALRDFVVAAMRMALQLAFVGLYLGFVFERNAWWLTLLWALCAVALSACEAVRRSKGTFREYWAPIAVALGMALVIALSFILVCVIGDVPFAEARTTIPLCGSYLGIGIKGLIIALRSFRRAVQDGAARMELMRGLGASLAEAYRPAVRRALGDAFAPLIANMSMMGLIVLPGALVGAVAGGASIRLAVEWQWLMMIGNATVSTLTCALVLQYVVHREARKERA